MSIGKKILLGIVTVVIWFVLCLITCDMNNIVFGVVFFSVPLVSLVLVVVGTIKFFNFMKKQEFSETVKIKRELRK